MKWNIVKGFVWCAMLGCMIACGGGVPKPAEEHRSANSSALIERMTPPFAYFEVPMSRKLDLVFGGVSLDDASSLVYVNLAGASVDKGFDLGESFIVCSDTVSVPAAQLSDKENDEVIYYVKKYIEEIMPDVKVVYDKPTDKYYSVVHVGGDAKILGCGSSDIKYTVPLDKDNIHPADVGFVFSAKTPDLDDLIVQIENAIEAMYDYQALATLALVDDPPGTKEINSMSRLLWELEKEKVANISVLQPELEALIPGGARYIDEFDKIITVTVGVGQQQASGTGTGSGTGTSVPSTSSGGGLFARLGQLLSGQILPTGGTTSSGTPAPTGSADLLSAFAVLSGHPEMALAAQILGPVLGGGASGVASTAKSADQQPLLPDYAALIDIKNCGSIGELFTLMEKHRSFVSANYDADTQSALDSMLVVAYSQAFRGMAMEQ